MSLVSVKSWDGHTINDGTNYSSHFNTSTGLPTLTPVMTAVNGGGQIVSNMAYEQRVLSPLEITIENGASIETLREQLHRWFDGRDNTAKRLVVTDTDGSSNERYIEAVCRGMVQKEGMGGNVYVAFLTQDGLEDKHYRWRKTTADTDTWNITSSGDTKTVSNGGHDECYPKLTITPTSASSGGYAYKVWVPVRWNIDSPHSNYPVDIVNGGWDTASLISGGKMQSDGDDLRVEVGGNQVNRWLDGINTSTTKVWVNLSFAAKVELTITANIAGTGSVDTIDFNEATTELPNSGIVMIGSEAFVYTGKNDALKRITGVTRASRGTSMAAHTAGDTAWWVQNDIYILYGNSSVSAPSVDDDYKPAFNLSTSTNTSWDYDEFGADAGLRSASWVFSNFQETTKYTDNHFAFATPWNEMGLYQTIYDAYGVWYINNPCGITNANFQGGESFSTVLGDWFARIYSGSRSNPLISHLEYSIPEPGTASTWDTWSQSIAPTYASTYFSMHLRRPSTLNPGGQIVALEVSDVTLTLNSSNTPTVSMTSEIGNYSLSCRITNNTTGESIDIDFTMELNESLEVDTDGKTVIYLKDNTSQLQARDLVGGVRAEWLPLAVGSNELEYTADDTGNVTIDLEWVERLYY